MTDNTMRINPSTIYTVICILGSLIVVLFWVYEVKAQTDIAITNAQSAMVKAEDAISMTEEADDELGQFKTQYAQSTQEIQDLKKDVSDQTVEIKNNTKHLNRLSTSVKVLEVQGEQAMRDRETIIKTLEKLTSQRNQM